MGLLKRKRGVASWSGRTATGSVGVVVCVVGVIALICAFGCEQRTGLRLSLIHI